VASAAANAVIVVASLTPFDEGEWIKEFEIFNPGLGGDRLNLALHTEDIELIQHAAAISDNVIVVLQGGSAITMRDWQDDVEAILMAWYPGVKGGQAIGETLFGDNNPSGKTPISWPVSEEQLYTFGSGMKEITYGYYQGYRYYDHLGITPLFPFGYGLSYTDFTYSNLQVSRSGSPLTEKILVHVDITNSGPLAGKEVVQFYVGYPETSIERAPKELKGFQKVSLAVGETQTITVEIPINELLYWDTANGQWQLEDTVYNIMVGSSSRDIHLTKATPL